MVRGFWRENHSLFTWRFGRSQISISVAFLNTCKYTIWLSEESDHFVGEVWDMIERPVEVMPGAWPKE